MVLVDDDMRNAGFDDANWIEQKVSRMQNQYLHNCEKNLMYISRRSKYSSKETAGRPSLPVTSVPTRKGEIGSHVRRSSPSSLGASINYLIGSKSPKLSRVRPLAEHESKMEILSPVGEVDEMYRNERDSRSEKLRISSLLYVADNEGMYVCKYCQYLLEGNGHDALRSHLKKCESYSLLKADFKKIDKKIRECQNSLTKISERAMNKCLQKAFDEFSAKMTTNFMLVNLLNDVINLKVDTFKNERVIDLQQHFQLFRNKLQQSTNFIVDGDDIDSLDEETRETYLDVVKAVDKLIVEKASKASTVMSLCEYVFKSKIYDSGRIRLYLAETRTVGCFLGNTEKKQFAIKVIDKKVSQDNQYSGNFLKEREILQVLRDQSDCFCHLHDSFMTIHHSYLVFDYEQVVHFKTNSQQLFRGLMRIICEIYFGTNSKF